MVYGAQDRCVSKEDEIRRGRQQWLLWDAAALCE